MSQDSADDSLQVGRIALIGAEGQLGRAMRTRFGDDNLVPLTHADIEIGDRESVRQALAKVEPDCVVNTAAYNFVDRAEDEPEEALRSNALGPRHLAAYCADRDIVLVHVSTDYVFGLDDSRRTPYRETDVPGPLNAYAVSKLAGEHWVRSLCARHYVLRTCGLFGKTRSPGSGNFVETILRLGQERDELAIVDDQRCTPTSALDLARAIDSLVRTGAYGLYHATNSGETTWFGFAREIVRLSGLNVTLREISSAEFGAKARRPHYSVLDTNRLTSTIGLELPDWQHALSKYLSERSD